MVAKNLNELFKQINKQVLDSMKKDVAPVVKEIESQSAKEELSMYHPTQYARRPIGGIDDPNNMIDDVEVIGNKVILSVKNITTGADESNRYIADLIEYGDEEYGGSYGQGNYTYPLFNRDNKVYTYLNPRPFTANAIDSLSTSQQHKKALMESLKKKGWKIQ